MENVIKIGVSACVVGHKVRFDSGHKTSAFLSKELSPYVEFMPICPEVAIGMSVPRPTIRLQFKGERIALVETKNTDNEHTDKMVAFSDQKARELIDEQLCGYVVCRNSPTCGMEKVKVYSKHNAEKIGVGLYTQKLIEHMPWLPIEEDGRLTDPYLKENFILRVFALSDFYQTMGDNPTAGKVVAFHSRYKLTLMAHHPESYKELGRLVANLGDVDIDSFINEYRLLFMNALKHRANRKTNTNVLMHLQGYLKNSLDKQQKKELAELILDYRSGISPLLAPLTLIKHHLSLHPDEYLSQQCFFQPYPQELRLRYGM
ncbi:DUF523 and DUF1722 domain-containing protein [Vibrio sp. SCSIO 43136]|uniref:YbgA family protein n=1 Tax=Vibrio sp. SCSIO 43136 TaxID=2819101 RepID=UPI0020765F48|nr:DUF523 and DUF1722 domain-containing protein [Vibrio sp. SCSIO 43136]USD67914.1 DUF1722 domain-containing protein [Vibrio sp. SCSIO 43136]